MNHRRANSISRDQPQSYRTIRELNENCRVKSGGRVSQVNIRKPATSRAHQSGRFILRRKAC